MPLLLGRLKARREVSVERGGLGCAPGICWGIASREIISAWRWHPQTACGTLPWGTHLLLVVPSPQGPSSGGRVPPASDDLP